MKLMITGLTVLLSFNLFATNLTWKIIGQDDLMTVNAKATNIPPQYKKLINAFGLMNNGCTATHIGRGIVITAGHCFYALAELAQNADCDDVTIDWGFREKLKPNLQSKCQKILFMQHDMVEKDFAIMKVSPVPKAAVGIDLVNASKPGDDVTVFSHPDESPLRWSQNCQIMPSVDTKLPIASLKHNCDTNGGSSGATIINIKTLKVVAIHNGGRLDEGTTNGLNYGTSLTNQDVTEILRHVGF